MMKIILKNEEKIKEDLLNKLPIEIREQIIEWIFWNWKERMMLNNDIINIDDVNTEKAMSIICDSKIHNIETYFFSHPERNNRSLLNLNSEKIISLIEWSLRFQLIKENGLSYFNEFLKSLKELLEYVVEHNIKNNLNKVKITFSNGRSKYFSKQEIISVFFYIIDFNSEGENIIRSFFPSILLENEIHLELEIILSDMISTVARNNREFLNGFHDYEEILQRGTLNFVLKVNEKNFNVLDMYNFCFFYVNNNQKEFKERSINYLILRTLNEEISRIKKINKWMKEIEHTLLIYSKNSNLFNFIPSWDTITQVKFHEKDIIKKIHSDIKRAKQENEIFKANIIWLDKNLDYIKDFYTGINKERDFILLLANYLKWLYLNAKQEVTIIIWKKSTNQYCNQSEDLIEEEADAILYESNYLFWCHRKNIIDYLNTDNRIEYENDEEEKERIKRIAYQNRKKWIEENEKQLEILSNQNKIYKNKYHLCDNCDEILMIFFLIGSKFFIYTAFILIYLVLIKITIKWKNRKINNKKNVKKF